MNGRRALGWALFGALALWVAFHSRDLEEVDDADLRARAGATADAGAPWNALLAAAQEGSEADVIAAIDAALAAPAPLEIAIPPLDAPGPSALALAEAAERIGARADAARAAGDDAEAWRDLERLLALGQRLAAARGAGLVETRLAVTLHAAALDRVDAWRATPGWSDADAQRARELVAANRLRDDRWKAVWAAEYENARELFLGMNRDLAADSGLPTFLVDRANYFYHPKRTLDRFARRCRATGAAYAVPCGADLALPADPEPWPLRYISPNAIGDILVSVARPDGTRVRDALCAHHARIEALLASHASGR